MDDGSEKIKDDDWRPTYATGYDKLLNLAVDKKNPKKFNFDIVMANPPFAGDIRDGRLVGNFDLSKKPNGKQLDKIYPRHLIH